MGPFEILKRKIDESRMSEDEKAIRGYLEKTLPRDCSENAFESTVEDVLKLDSDLREYVLGFIESNDASTDIECEIISIKDLLETKKFTPVTAALFIQWYRRDSKSATLYIMHHDEIRNIPKDLPEIEDDEEDSDEDSEEVPEANE